MEEEASNRVVADDTEASDAAESLWQSLAKAISFVLLSPRSPASPSPSPSLSSACGSAPYAGPATFEECVSVYALRRLFLLCGVKRHHCDALVLQLLGQLLVLCYPSPASAPLPERSTASAAPPAVRRAWATAGGWEADARAVVSAEELLLSHMAPEVRRSFALRSREHCRDADATVERPPSTPTVPARYAICVAHEEMERAVAKLFTEELRGQMMTVNPTARWRMACRFLLRQAHPGAGVSADRHAEDRAVSLVVFCGGTSGTGKSTLASLIAAQLGIDQVLSTDTVRQVLRASTTREASPELFVSTYQAYQTARHAAGNTDAAADDDVIHAYERQCAAVLDVLDSTLERLVGRGRSMVVEGAHLLPAYMARKQSELWARRVMCLSVLVHIRKEERHRERFAVRVKSMTLSPAHNKYVSSFAEIRCIQAFLTTQAHELPVLSINNTNVDKSAMVVHYAVLQLMERVATGGWPVGADIAPAVGPSDNLSAKRMLLYLREHKKEKEAKRKLPPQQQLSFPASCPHSPTAACNLCRALQLIGVSYTPASRARSAELRRASQRHLWSMTGASLVSLDADADPQQQQQQQQIAATHARAQDTTPRAVPSTACLQAIARSRALGRRSSSYDSPASPRARQSTTPWRDAPHHEWLRSNTDSKNCGSDAQAVSVCAQASGARNSEEDEFGSLVEQPL